MPRTHQSGRDAVHTSAPASWSAAIHACSMTCTPPSAARPPMIGRPSPSRRGSHPSGAERAGPALDPRRESIVTMSSNPANPSSLGSSRRPRRIGVGIGLLVWGAVSAVSPVAFPDVAPQATAAETCRTVVVPGSGAVATRCGTPVPKPVKKCSLAIALGAGASALTGGGAAPGALGGAAGCLADAMAWP